jgi:vancomycin permeability regulator SanA
MLRIGLIVGLGLAAWIGLHAAWTIVTGLNAQPLPSDVEVVLGTRVLPSGVPSVWLRSRLERGLELYRNGTAKNIIVSGGLGREGHEEADVMRDYLTVRGVPAENIFVDRNGYDTYETARSVQQIMASENFKSVVVVSHYYHLPRAVLTFRRFNIPNVSATGVSTPPIWNDGGNLLREFAAFYFYLVRDYATT